MLCQAAFDQWQTTIMHHLSPLSKPQATVLALWSFGMVLARSCALSAEGFAGALGYAPGRRRRGGAYLPPGTTPRQDTVSTAALASSRL
jgi:hypothetical protein